MYKKRKNFVRDKEKRKRIYGRRKVYGKERKICKREGELIYDVRRKDGKKEGKKEITYRYVGKFFFR